MESDGPRTVRRTGNRLAEFISTENDPYRIATRLLLGTTPIQWRTWIPGLVRPASRIRNRMRHKNLAFAVQDTCERSMLSLARRRSANRLAQPVLRRRRGVQFQGQRKNPLFRHRGNIFVQPAASDDGACLGAVLAPLSRSRRGASPPQNASRQARERMQRCRNREALATYKIRATRVCHPRASRPKCRRRKNYRVVAGAHGIRSTRARQPLHSRRPRAPEMNCKVNNAVKFREWWRPFAPSMLAEVADEYLESAIDSPFMILTAQVRIGKRSVIPAVTHADGSARPQTVERSVNPLYWQSDPEFGKRTGVPVVMNTSFNLRGEPIVANPTDAIRTFFSSGLDALVIGEFWWKNREHLTAEDPAAGRSEPHSFRHPGAMPKTAISMIALLGHTDTPVDGVEDYCSYLSCALERFDARIEVVHVSWFDIGWFAAIRRLARECTSWQRQWVVLQFTALAWSRHGFPFGVLAVLAVLRNRGVRCAVMFHEPDRHGGSRWIDRVRGICQDWVIRKIYRDAELAILPDPLPTIPWLPTGDSKAVFIPIGANLPYRTPKPATNGMVKTVAVFCLSGAFHLAEELKDISEAIQTATAAGAQIRLLFLGRGTNEAKGDIAGIQEYSCRSREHGAAEPRNN